MTDQPQSAQDIIDDLSPTVPMKPASEMLDADRMRAEGQRQERERQRFVDQANADGGPRLR